MKRLNPLPTPPSHFSRYESIRDSKQQATQQVLLSVHAQLSAAYGNFRLLSGMLEKLPPEPLPEAARSALRACYDSPTRALKQLKADIRAAQPLRQLKYCPMCGTTWPHTFDHYLPAERFPEFAVLAANLVPCCSVCNSIKADDWLDASGARQYVHAFADNIPNAQFLFATLHELPSLWGVGVTFEITQPPAVSAGEWALIQSHFARLHLLERYNRLGNEQIAEVLASCRSFLAAGGTDAPAFLVKEAADRAEVYGRNHWTAVLTGALAAHPKLLDYVGAMPV